MIELVRELVVRPENQDQFELLFGRGGAWGRLFSASPGFRGTTVLHDTNNSGRYLLIDIWDTVAQQEQALREHADEYAKLNADLEAWTETRREVGVFRVRAEATVRPREKPGRRNRGTSP